MYNQDENKVVYLDHKKVSSCDEGDNVIQPRLPMHAIRTLAKQSGVVRPWERASENHH